MDLQIHIYWNNRAEFYLVENQLEELQEIIYWNLVWLALPVDRFRFSKVRLKPLNLLKTEVRWINKSHPTFS